MKISYTLPAIVATIVVAANTTPNHGFFGLLSSHHNDAEHSDPLTHLIKHCEPYVKRAKIKPISGDAAKSEPKTRKNPGERSKASTHNEKAPQNYEAAPSQSNAHGLIEVDNEACGHSGATVETTATTGPNGSLDWMNCGINDGGWRPPKISIDGIVYKDLSNAAKDHNNPFNACAKFVPIFNKYGGQFGLPPIMLASFAMQESSCISETVGEGGEQGLMQITRDKCGGAPDDNCRDPDFNIKMGAKYFADTLRNNGGDLLLSIGMYNGYRRGLTFGQATAAANSVCCLCQNNLDYLHQFLNGWMQGINAYDTIPRLGKYFNLDRCQ